MDSTQPGPPESTLEGANLRLRRVRESDRPRLLEILSEPSVAQWWNDPQRALESLFEPDEFAYGIEVDGRLCGAIEFYEENDPDYRHAGIDIFLESDRQGRGLGPRAIALLARYLVDERGHHRLIIDPAATNERAIRAYERVGFRPVGIMRGYERGPDGSWHDGLLMDMLAGELRRDLADDAAASGQDGDTVPGMRHGHR